MTTITSSEDAEDSLNVSDITVQNAAPANPYTEELDDFESDELDSSQVITVLLITTLANQYLIFYCRHGRGDALKLQD